ncbi:MAG TPA: hypothetical protein VGK25_00760 [Ignavibacteria bacterium]|jgi:hypothetical protein
MKVLLAILSFSFILTVYSQNKDFRLKENSNITFNNHYPSKSLLDSNTKEKTTVSKSKKSPGLAFIYSLLVPGLGHVYAHRFETGKYFMITEAASWLTFAAFSVYGNWMLDDAYSYSVTHAGVNLSGKERDEKFFTDIANYNNVEEYNDEKLRFGEYDQLYYPEKGYGFYWDTEANRKKYREDKIAGDRILNDRLFVIGAVVINHIVSAISAVFAANSYNDEISKKSSGGLTLRAGVQKHFNKIDGISLKMGLSF